MKKHLIIILLSIVTVLSAAAKAGNRFEWYPYDDPYQDSGVLVFEIISDEEKTMKIVKIHPPDINKPINYITTPRQYLCPLPSDFRDYHIIEIAPNAFDNPLWGKEVEIIAVNNISTIGDYAFFGSCMPFSIKNSFQYSLTVNLYSVESIGEYAFANSEIYDMSVHSLIPPNAHKNSFSDITYQKCKVRIPYGTWEAYFYHPVWGQFKDIQTAFDCGVNDVSTDEVTYCISGNEIIVSGATDGTSFYLFDATGRCIDRIQYQNENINILKPSSAGIYILHYYDKNLKIMIRP